MGIGKGAFQLLLQEKKKGNLNGKSILQLGRQFVFFTYSKMQKLAQKHDVVLTPVHEVGLSFDAELRKKGCIDDITLFKSLGFDKVESLDVSPFEKSSITLDLNEPIPQKYWEGYDAIFDGGTSEHIFDFPQVLRNIHLLLKKNGIIIHCSPSNNCVDHGYYAFSPTIFYEYYAANKYSILTSNIFEFFRRPEKAPWNIYSYSPGLLDGLSFGGFGKSVLGTYFVAQKQVSSTNNIVPQQGFYHRQWGKKSSRKRNKSAENIAILLNRVLAPFPKRFRGKIRGAINLFFPRILHPLRGYKINKF